MGDDINGFLAILLCCSIPIVAIVSGVYALVRKHRNDYELRRALIENHVDAETSKLLVSKPKRADGNPFAMLRSGSILVGISLGVFLAEIVGFSFWDFPYWGTVAFGIGLGMLVAFAVELRLRRRQRPADDEE